MHEIQPPTNAPMRTPEVGWRWLVGIPMLSGFLLWASFFFSWFVWVALVPLGLTLKMRGRIIPLYGGAYLGGLTFFLPGTYWLRYCDDSAWLAWSLLAAYLALYFPFFVLIARILHRFWRLPLLVIIPAVWITTEYLRMHLLTGFGWLLVAHSTYRWTWTIQLADCGGVWMVSLWITLVNAVLVELLTIPLVIRQQPKPRWNPALRWRLQMVGAMFILVQMYGGWRVWQGEAVFEPGVSAVLIQTNIPQNVRNDDVDTTYRAVEEPTLAQRDRVVDMIVWPECSYLYPIGDVDPYMDNVALDQARIHRGAYVASLGAGPPSAANGATLRSYLADGHTELTRLTNNVGIPLIVSAIRYDARHNQLQEYNSTLLFAPQFGRVGYYDKIHLVPFGEYLPLQDTMPFLRRLMPYEEGFEFGLDAAMEFRTLHWQKINAAALICFEDTLPHLAREFVMRATDEKPIDFFVNQCNDGWFRGSVESDYHLAAAVFRCVENRVPMVRASNMGVTALVDGNGVVRQRLPKKVAETLYVDIPFDPRVGAYVTLGDALPQLLLTLVIALLSGAFLAFWREVFRRLFLPRSSRTASKE